MCVGSNIMEIRLVIIPTDRFLPKLGYLVLMIILCGGEVFRV